jgi:arylsulfatase A-like enzyme
MRSVSARAVRRSLPLAVLFTALACDGPHDQGGRRVFLLTCDTLRAARLGVYGYERDTSPELDALAAEGAVFEEAYATAPMTQPSISSLLTGRLPEHIGVARGNLRRLPSEVETLAERLRREGIATAAVISNWVLRRAPGELDVGAHQGFEHYDDRMDEKERNRDAYERSARSTTDAALEWLSGRGERESFFLWVHYQDPHGPYTPPRGLGRAFEREPTAEPALPAGDSVLGRGQIPNYQLLGAERRPSVYRDLYDAEIRYFDRELGRLLADLRDRGWLEDATVIFTSDHGESLGEHDYWFCHGENVHREVVRVPLVVVAPNGQRGHIDDVASLLDVWPTVLESFDIDPGPTLGRSLLRPTGAGRLVGQSLVPRAKRDRWWAVSDGRWRVVWNDAEPTPKLYDIRADPHEERQALVDAGAEGAVELGAEMGLSGDDDNLEALKYLGYVDGEEE